MTDYFPGSIDDIRIYNRVLNQQEITYLATHWFFDTLSYKNVKIVTSIYCLTNMVGLFYAHKQNEMNTKNKVQLIGKVNTPNVNRLETEIMKATFIIETPSSYYNEKGMKT